MRILSRAAAILCATSAVSAMQATDKSPLPSPTGQYAVGREYFDWVAVSPPGDGASEPQRELAVWVWYPAAVSSDAKPAEWMPGKWGDVFWSEFVKAHPTASSSGDHLIRSIRSHAYASAPVASGAQRRPAVGAHTRRCCERRVPSATGASRRAPPVARPYVGVLRLRVER